MKWSRAILLDFRQCCLDGQQRGVLCKLPGSGPPKEGGGTAHGYDPFSKTVSKGGVVVKLNVRDRESIQEAVRRFRKLVERSGIKKEMRRKEYYEKPSETRRRARLRAERRTRRGKLPA
jgi:small subunit ribosomal protein S21